MFEYRQIASTGCDLVKFRGTLKLRIICMGYISNEVFTNMKGPTYALTTLLTPI